MLAFHTENSAGAKTARMEQRTTLAAKELIERAAYMLGINASEFTVAAAARAARDTLRQYQTTVLKPEACDAFMKALDSTEPSSDLVDLMAFHAEVINGDGP